MIDQALVKKGTELEKQIEELGRKIENKKEELRLVGDTSQNLQRTINQLIELQKLTIQKGITLSESEQINLTTSLSSFLKSQEQYQELNSMLSHLISEKQQLEDEQRVLDEQIEDQKKPARKEYETLNQKHDLKLAGFQLLILLPLLVLGAFLILKKRSSIYFPLFLAFAGATLLKVTLVIHEYFPTKYFKYIIISVLIVAVIRILIHFIQIVAYPKFQWLHKQYREAYERFLCPVCEYPIRLGPRKFLF